MICFQQLGSTWPYSSPAVGAPGSNSTLAAGNNLLSAAAATHGNNAYSTLSGAAAASAPHQAAAAASFFPNYIMAAQQAAVAGYGCLSGPGAGAGSAASGMNHPTASSTFGSNAAASASQLTSTNQTQFAGLVVNRLHYC